MSTAIDVSIATVYSGVYFDFFQGFLVFFSDFPLRFLEEGNPLCFYACFDLVCFLEQLHIFFDVVIINCMTAGLGFKMAATKFIMVVLGRHCDVISRHN